MLLPSRHHACGVHHQDSESAAMSGQLVERSGGRLGAVHGLDAPPVSIGRSADNRIVVTSDRVSRHHAHITWDGTHHIVEDLASTNGTFVNGTRLTAPHALRHGDLLGVGPLTLLYDAADATVRDDDAPAATRIRVDTATAELWVDGHTVHVSAKEYLAVQLLYQKRGALVTKEELATQVWPEYAGAIGDASIEQIIFRLRRKLEQDPERPRHLLTVRGLGYRLIDA
jgi:hypothetical protein